MPYQRRTLKEIPKCIHCPCCGEYNTNKRESMINHLKKCDEYEGHIDDIYTYDLDEELTLGENIDREENNYNTMKKFIQSNELEAIQNRTMDEIIDYIEAKMFETIRPFEHAEYNAIRIYEFFFGSSEESMEKMKTIIQRILEISPFL